MARPAVEKTPIQIAAAKARENFTKAHEKANAPGAKETDKKAAEHAREVRNAAIKKENRERFEKIGGARVLKAVSALETVANISNRKTYDFDTDDFAVIEKTLTDALTNTLTRFRNTLAGKAETASVSGPLFASKL